jgi:hypothetical protein
MCIQNDTKSGTGFSHEKRMPIDPDQVFDRDHDRDENFLIKVW